MARRRRARQHGPGGSCPSSRTQRPLLWTTRRWADPFRRWIVDDALLDAHPRAPAGDTVAAPAELRGRIADHVREHRARRGLSLADLAARAGIGKSTLHQLERGEATPSIETLWAVANALGVPFGELIEPTTPRVTVVRADAGHPVASGDATMHARLLASGAPARRLEIYRLEFADERERVAEPHLAGAVEHVLVVEGRLRTGPVGEEVELDAGDLATFPGSLRHRYEALAPGTTALLVMEYR